MRYLILGIGLMAGPALAWELREGDTPLAPAELEAALIGQDIVYYDDGRSDYGGDGSYAYTYSEENGGGTQRGTYDILPDGMVCIVYENGFDRCDRFVMSASGRFTLITEEGERYPIRP